MSKEITIYDLANKLGLSTATISRALNNNEVISQKTRDKVQNAARKLGYRHNNFASNLRRQKSNTLGIIVHELKSNFITSVLAGIEKVTTLNGYNLIITHSAEQGKREVDNANNLFHQRVDGIIASLAFDTKNLDHFTQFENKNIPVVFFDRVEEKSKFQKVVLDNVQGGYIATKHLIDKGCNNIAMVTSPLNRNVYKDRHIGYKKALTEAGIEYNKSKVFVKDLSEKSANETAEEIINMKPRPNGVFITNDFVAAVCMHSFQKNGLRVPEDIAIVGFNNDAVSKLVQPELTTIDYPGEYIGELAATALIHSLKPDQNSKNKNSAVLKPELIVRGSSLHKR